MAPARRLAAVAVIATVALTLVGGGHVYIARRLVWDPELPDPWRTLALTAVFGGLACMILQPFGERLLRPPLSRLIAWPASIWMGLAFILLLLLGTTDVLRSLAPAALAAGRELPAWEAAAGRALGVALTAAVLALFAMRSALGPPRLVRLEVALPDWPAALNGFRILQLSDIHIGPILGRRFARQLVDRVNAREPDLVAITGDLVDGKVSLLCDEVAPFADLRSRHGVYFVTGNHDYFSDAAMWTEKVRELGMRPLRNERVAIEQDGACFDLAGVDDHRGKWTGQDDGEDLDAALEGRDPERPLLLLAHDPSTFKRASECGVGLQLSGHTHGGQIWPFRWLVRLVIPFVEGFHRRGASQLYVSRGTGFWGPPMRLFAPAEITEIALHRGAEA